jgi:hypothetical protein
MGKLVYLESPYAGDVEKNIKYARLCMKDSLDMGEYPFASHLLYTQENILNDNDPVERTLGIVAGFAFAKFCSKTVIYADLGISNGMMLGIEDAIKNKRIIEVRYLKNFKSMF